MPFFVTGGLLIILIALMAVMIVVRYRNNKHPIPAGVRKTVRDFRNRLSRAPPAYSMSVPPQHTCVENQYMDDTGMPLGAVATHSAGLPANGVL